VKKQKKLKKRKKKKEKKHQKVKFTTFSQKCERKKVLTSQMSIRREAFAQIFFKQFKQSSLRRMKRDTPLFPMEKRALLAFLA